MSPILRHYINDKITLPYLVSIVGLDRIDEVYIESQLNNYTFEANPDNYRRLYESTDLDRDMFFPSLSELKINKTKIMLMPVAIDIDTKEVVTCRSLSFEKLEDININQITHFYGIEKRKKDDSFEYIFRGIYKMNGYELAKNDCRYQELQLNLLPHEMKAIDDQLRTLDVTTYGQYLNFEQDKLIDSF